MAEQAITKANGYIYRPLAPMRAPADLAAMLHSDWFLKGLADILPATVPPDARAAMATRAAAQMTLAFMRDPENFICTQESIVRAGLDLATTRLSLSKAMNEACLVRYRNRKANITELQFQPMYQGLIKLVSRAAQVKSIAAEVVYEKEPFDVEKGSVPRLVHTIIPNIDRRDAKLVAAYSVAHIPDSPPNFVVMWRAEIEQVRQVSKQKDSGPWRDWYPEMCKKTAIRRLQKVLPKTEDDPLVELALERALAADNQTYTLGDQQIQEMQDAQRQAKDDELARRRAMVVGGAPETPDGQEAKVSEPSKFPDPF